MSQVSVRGLKKSFGNTVAVDDVSFSVEAGEFTAIVGPSGSGKTTVLRCIAGVERPDEGEIELGGRTVFSSGRSLDVPPEGRGVGMVYQTLALWPHLNVFENIAYPLRIRGLKRGLDGKVKKFTSMLKIGELENRYPPELSGGEQQRVALARALVYDPSLVLLDEPFSNLDAPLREELGDELKLVQRATGATMVYVTHDRMEAISLSRSLVLMNMGKVVSTGPPLELYSHPPDAYTAAFLSGMLVLEAEVVRGDSGTRLLSTILGKIALRQTQLASGRVKVALPPAAISITSDASNGVLASVRGVAYPEPGVVNVRLDIGGQVVNVPMGARTRVPEPGDTVRVVFDDSAVRILKD